MVGIKLPAIDPAIPHGTYYWSCSGIHFKVTEHTTANHREWRREGDGVLHQKLTGQGAVANVQLPHGAVVTGAIVYSDSSDETWTLYRYNLNGRTAPSTVLASANLNSEDTSIANATIDNSTYKYWFVVTGMDDEEFIYGARITYTL